MPSSPTTDDQTAAKTDFAALGLPEPLLRSLKALGYESPSPIQQGTIPALLAGQDLLGQAQTGTGKTAAFALPILARLDLQRFGPQALVLTPTRELSLQVAEAFQRYAAHLPGFHVLPVYGGQAYGPQLGGLRRGAHVVVGTPGRVIDHLKRGTLSLAGLSTLVLDEADEMLRMGFIDDVEEVLSQAPAERQVALFSATMPPQIRRIAQTHLRDPQEITIRARTTTTANTRQRYWLVGGLQKLDGLTRLLEVEPFDGMIVFVRTKLATEELAGRLQARGFAVAPLHGDMQQQQRERTIRKLKDGELDILVATDVAARGLDVQRISHVVNYDIPYDAEAYVHRIGRTGRAGRSGEAILFVTHREQRLLRSIERATGQPIEALVLPTVAEVNLQRIAHFKDKITAALASPQLNVYRDIVEEYAGEQDVPAVEIAAALAHLAQGDKPLLDPVSTDKPKKQTPLEATFERQEKPRKSRDRSEPEVEMERYWLAVGNKHNVQIGHIVGAIANEAGLDGRYIRNIEVGEDHTLVDLPTGMPRSLLKHLRKVRVAGRPLQIRLQDEDPEAPDAKPKPPQKTARSAKPAGKSARAKPPQAAGKRQSSAGARKSGKTSTRKP